MSVQRKLYICTSNWLKIKINLKVARGKEDTSYQPRIQYSGEKKHKCFSDKFFKLIKL